jgi:hypothetical protein
MTASQVKDRRAEHGSMVGGLFSHGSILAQNYRRMPMAFLWLVRKSPDALAEAEVTLLW